MKAANGYLSGETNMNSKNKSSKVKAIFLKDHIQYSKDSVVSKTLIDKKVGTVTLFAFDRGQKLSEHTTPYDALVQILEGDAELVIGGETINATAGQIVVMPADVPHAVNANEQFKMILTMIRS